MKGDMAGMAMQYQNGETQIKTDAPAEFAALSGETVAARLKRIVFRPQGGGAFCEISLEIGGDAAKNILENEWFHLFRGMMSELPAFDFEAPFELRAALRPGLAARILREGGDAETVLHALLPAGSGEGKAAGGDLRHTECWLALELVQRVELPEELAGGVLKQGIRTIWREQLGKAQSADQGGPGPSPAPLVDQVEACLQDKQLKYERLDERLIRLRFHSERGEWVTLIRIEPEEEMVILYSVFPELVPEQLRPNFALRFMSENYELTAGSFEMDEEDGELRFRSALMCGGGIDPGEFGAALTEQLTVMEHYLPVVAQMLQAAD